MFTTYGGIDEPLLARLVARFRAQLLSAHHTTLSTLPVTDWLLPFRRLCMAVKIQRYVRGNVRPAVRLMHAPWHPLPPTRLRLAALRVPALPTRPIFRTALPQGRQHHQR